MSHFITWPRLSSFVESDMLPKGGGCAPAPGLQGGLLLVKQYTIISQGHTGPHLPHKRTYKVLSTKTRIILWSCIIPPQAGIHST